MPSNAFGRFANLSDRAVALLDVAKDARLRPLAREKQQAYAHAALAVLVSGWETYLEALVAEFYARVARPTDSGFLALHVVSLAGAQTEIKRFNTPNWENARNLLVQNTGYDPYADWIWPAARMNAQAVRNHLDDVLRVRHSFAHGSAIPHLTWTLTPRGAVCLRHSTVMRVRAFFFNLARRTDRGMRRHIQQQFGITAPW